MNKLVEHMEKNHAPLMTAYESARVETVMKEIEERKIELIPDTEENRELIRAEVERMTADQSASLEVDEATSEDELERRILSALSKGQN